MLLADTVAVTLHIVRCDPCYFSLTWNALAIQYIIFSQLTKTDIKSCIMRNTYRLHTYDHSCFTPMASRAFTTTAWFYVASCGFYGVRILFIHENLIVTKELYNHTVSHARRLSSSSIKIVTLFISDKRMSVICAFQCPIITHTMEKKTSDFCLRHVLPPAIL